MSTQQSKIKEWRRFVDAAVANRAASKAAWVRSRKTLAQAEVNFAAADEAQQIAQLLAESVQAEARNRIAGVVSQCLATVFDEPYEFNIRFEQTKRGTEARLVFTRDGHEVNPLDASGGGVVDVASFALRVSALMLSRPSRRRLMVLDEPFKFVSADRIDAVRVMLEQLASDLGIQFIMVTHIDGLQCGSVVILPQ